MKTLNDKKPNHWPAKNLLQAYASGTTSPTETVEEALSSAREFDELNAFQVVDKDKAKENAARSLWRYERKMPLGILDGLPAAIKDSFDAKGYATRHGSKTTSSDPVDLDSPSVAAMRRVGAVILGRTTMSEYGWKAVCDCPLTGITRNPWDRRLTPGGSSGGDAVSIAVGASTLAVGADIGGSVRIPASFCGMVGFKPTHDRASQHPGSHAGVLSREGPITRCVHDAALLMDALDSVARSDPPTKDPETFQKSLEGKLQGVRIALLTEHPDLTVDERVAKVVKSAAEAFEVTGAEVYPIDSDSLNLGGIRSAYEMLLGSELVGEVHELEEEQWQQLDPGLRDFTNSILNSSVSDLIEASQVRKEQLHKMSSFHQDYDLLVTPTVPILPFEAGREVPENWPHERWTSWTPFTWPFNMTGQPALSVPCGFVDGLPVGLQIVGARRFDGTVLRAGYALERALALDMSLPG